MPPDAPQLSILLISGDYERAHYAFMLAVGAGAIGRRVVLFATNSGTHGLKQDWSGLTGAGQDAAVQAAGAAGLDELREAAQELGIRLLACDTGLRIAGVAAESLLEGVEVAGIPTLLALVGNGPLTTM